MEHSAHTHIYQKAILNRISRAAGHLNAVKKMVEQGRDCSEILIQLAAIRAEITGMSKVIVKEHIEHCITDAVQSHDEQAMEQLKGAIERLL